MKIAFIFFLIATSLVHADTLSPEQKSKLSNYVCSNNDATCGEQRLKFALQDHLRGTDLQVTAFSAPGFILGGSVGFTLKSAETQLSFKCDFNSIHESDAVLSDCIGTDKSGKSVPLADVNLATTSQKPNSLRLDGLLQPNPDTIAGSTTSTSRAPASINEK